MSIKKFISENFRNGDHVGIFTLMCLCIAAVWLVWPSIVAYFYKELEDQGQFGDLFGGLNAIFTAFAFAAVFWTGRMQKEELALQRNELALQRDEIKKNRGVLQIQAFESTFFRMIEQYSNIVSRDKDRISTCDRSCVNGLLKIKLRDQLIPTKDDIDLLFYNQIYPEYEIIIGVLFRNIYQTFKLIDNAPISEAEKKVYANITRAQIGRKPSTPRKSCETSAASCWREEGSTNCLP